ncbi:MAG: hypothetical protein M0R77_16520 [Gammaproteobacteria bacterium]|nr:hypothetical protein [Gammaproteobacteria bacterium]
MPPASDISVQLNYRPLGLVSARARNLRLDGMFVDTGAVTLPHHSEVEVTLSFRKDDRLQVHRLQARVMGRSKYGTNLTFQNCRRETYQALQEMIGSQTH